MQLIEGDILQIEKGIICHFCNQEGVFGAGLAAQVKSVFPAAYEEYRASKRYLGTYSLCEVKEDLIICNMITQDLKGRGTQYSAVLKALRMLWLAIEDAIEKVSLDTRPAIYFPEFVGCGLGKGNPNAIQAMIEHYFPDAILVRYSPTTKEPIRALF